MRSHLTIPAGTIVRFRGNPFGLLNRHGVVVQSDGRGVTVKTEGCDECLVGRDEVSVVRRRPASTLVSLRSEFPYGKWTCIDGREVLFNRDYKPIWQRNPSGLVAPANRSEWVPFIKQEWIYSEGQEPWCSRESRLACIRLLASWGVHVAAPLNTLN